MLPVAPHEEHRDPFWTPFLVVAVAFRHCGRRHDGGCGQVCPPKSIRGFPTVPARQPLGEPPCPQVNPWFPHPKTSLGQAPQAP